MTKKQKTFLFVSILLIIGIWALLAFFIREELVSRFSLWASLIIGTATTITSVLALFISYLSLKRNEEAKAQKREEDARLFIHDNNDEIDYLPFCIYASCYDRHGHHTRKIYDNFCRLSDEMQKEVLKQANYDIPLISDADWVYEKIDIIDKFAREYGFGDTFLYDSGKHFFHGYESKEELYKDDYNYILKDVFGMYGSMTRIFNRKGISIDEYFEGYAYRRFRDQDWLKNHDYIPPGDLLIEVKELRDVEKTSSYEVAYWICHEIEDLYYIIEEYFYNKKPAGIIVNDAQPEFFEDKFYEVLNLLYCMDDYSKYSLIIKEPYDKKEN